MSDLVGNLKGWFSHDEANMSYAIAYHNDPKYLDRQLWANNTDPDQTAPQSNQGLHCLLILHLHHLEVSHHGRTF